MLPNMALYDTNMALYGFLKHMISTKFALNTEANFLVARSPPENTRVTRRTARGMVMDCIMIQEVAGSLP